MKSTPRVRARGSVVLLAGSLQRRFSALVAPPDLTNRVIGPRQRLPKDSFSTVVHRV